VDEAKVYFDNGLARGEIAPAKATGWADTFADYGQLDTALALLQAAQSREPDEEAQSRLDLSQVVLCLRIGKTDKALTLIESLSSKYQDKPYATRGLDDNRIAVARALLASGQAQDKTTAERLVADIERAEPSRTDAKSCRHACCWRGIRPTSMRRKRCAWPRTSPGIPMSKYS